jgi:hypothetical protein
VCKKGYRTWGNAKQWLLGYVYSTVGHGQCLAASSQGSFAPVAKRLALREEAPCRIPPTHEKATIVLPDRTEPVQLGSGRFFSKYISWIAI